MERGTAPFTAVTCNTDRVLVKKRGIGRNMRKKTGAERQSRGLEKYEVWIKLGRGKILIKGETSSITQCCWFADLTERVSPLKIEKKLYFLLYT